jgi:hypothetical protein
MESKAWWCTSVILALEFEGSLSYIERSLYEKNFLKKEKKREGECRGKGEREEKRRKGIEKRKLESNFI